MAKSAGLCLCNSYVFDNHELVQGALVVVFAESILRLTVNNVL